VSTCPAPDAPDGVPNSKPSSPSIPHDELLAKLGEALQVLIHAQAQQAHQVTQLVLAIQELIAYGTAQNEDRDEDEQPTKGLDGLPIRRSS
jgi:hypothetical protein